MENRTSIVIFGASGDLTRRKLIPSLLSLFCKGRIPEKWQIVGVARTRWTNDEFRQHLTDGMKELAPEKFNEENWQLFAPRIQYVPCDLSEVGELKELDAHLTQFEEGHEGKANRIYYLSIAPKLYSLTISNLGKADMVNEASGWRRVVIEKPFGHNLESAQALNEAVHKDLQESQIYRMDHYLGKETVQNIMVFRFANSLFEPVWNRNYIDHVQITAAETVDVGHRASYYDGVGVVRDMVQNHVLQLLSLVAMEPPASFDADALRNEKVKVFSSLRLFDHKEILEHTIRGQYRGYRQAEGVKPRSKTPTFGAFRLFIDNWRWQGVPFYLRSGKALADKTTEIGILFKRPPHVMFPLPPNQQIRANRLSICIQPDEGIHFSFQVKVPDTAAEMKEVRMNFDYFDTFDELAIPDAYERLLLDIIKGDPSLFTRGDAIELAWRLVDRILETWESDNPPPLHFYEPGSWGPDAAEYLIDHGGYRWTLGC